MIAVTDDKIGTCASPRVGLDVDSVMILDGLIRNTEEFLDALRRRKATLQAEIQARAEARFAAGARPEALDRVLDDVQAQPASDAEENQEIERWDGMQ